MRGGELLAEHGVLPDVVHTSLQVRAIHTAELALRACDRSWIPVRRSWRLNERHYGDLQGKDKKQTAEEFGEEKLLEWRRSYDVPPPPLDWDASADPRYRDLPAELIPKSECLADVVDRMLPYWYDAIVPDLAAGPGHARRRARQLAARAGEAPRGPDAGRDPEGQHRDRPAARLRARRPASG